MPSEFCAITIPVIGGEYPIGVASVAEWADLFPAVDVAQELRNMRAWCIARPSQRKTPGGVLKFVITWLTKEQNQGGRFRGSPPPRPGATPAKVYRQG